MTASIVKYQPVMGSRYGSAVANFSVLQTMFGEPRRFGKYRDFEDDKVTVTWTFKTPRGLAELRDYWWNAENEWSIGASNQKAAMHLCKMLRRSGIPASSRFHYGRDARAFVK